MTNKTYNELRTIAKEMGIKANQPKEVLIKEIMAKSAPTVINARQGYWIVKALSSKGTTYMATKLHGELAKYNNKLYTVKLSRLLGIVAESIRLKNNIPKGSEVSINEIQKVLDTLVHLKYLGRDYSHDTKTGEPVAQYFVNTVKCKELLERYK